MVGTWTTVNLGCLLLCWGLLGSSVWVWCRGQYLQEDILQCAVMLGFLAWLLLHCVVGRVEKLQAWGLGFEQFKMLKELVVNFFQLPDGLV